MHSQLSDRIRAARLQRGLSQAELAVLVGVSASAVAHWERAAATPSMKIIGVLVSVLRAPPMWLLFGCEEHRAAEDAALAVPPAALNHDETRLLAAYRRLGDESRRALLTFAVHTTPGAEAA